MKIGICDDEPSELVKLKQLIEIWGKQHAISVEFTCYNNGNELLASIQTGASYDVLFLDIYMGEIDGISLARQIRSFNKTARIIFVTNSPDHAIESYGVQAVHYLLKPVAPAALNEALERAVVTVPHPKTGAIEIRNNRGTYQCFFDDIIYAESEGRIVTVYTKTQIAIKYYDKLDNLEYNCMDSRFLRCHKSFLINLDYVHSIQNNVAVLQTGDKIPISRPVSEVKDLFTSYITRKMTG